MNYDPLDMLSLAIPPPAPRVFDPINPNPLITQEDLETALHYRLMSLQTVEEMRLLGCQLIQSGIKLLKMSQAALYTAQILFNQFFSRNSLLAHPLLDVVMAAVFVAGKVEECIRRARDIVNVFHHLYCLIRKLPAHPIEYVGDTYYVWRDRLCSAEAILLRELGFHVQPASPVSNFISYIKIMELQEQHPDLPQLALNFLNDALKTMAAVLFQPCVLASAAISLAADRLQIPLPLPADSDIKLPWYALFDVNGSEIGACRKIILSLYYRELDVLLPLTKEELKIFTEHFQQEEESDTTREKSPPKYSKRADHQNPSSRTNS